MSTSTQPRKSKGQPIGGQFDVKTQAEDELGSLGAMPASSQTFGEFANESGRTVDFEAMSPVTVEHEDGTRTVVYVAYSNAGYTDKVDAASPALDEFFNAEQVINGDENVAELIPDWIAYHEDNGLDRVALLAKDENGTWKALPHPADAEGADDAIHAADAAVILPRSEVNSGRYPTFPDSNFGPPWVDYAEIADTINSSSSNRDYVAVAEHWTADGHMDGWDTDDWDGTVSGADDAEMAARSMIESAESGELF